MHRRIWHLYDKLLQENGVTDRQFLDDLDFWNIEELEMVMADIQKGHALPDILDEKEKNGYFKDPIRNFYIIKRGHFDKHSVIEEAFELMTEQTKDILFRERFKK